MPWLPFAGKKPFFEIPVFNYHKGYLSVNYSDNYYLLSQRHAEVPKLQVCIDPHASSLARAVIGQQGCRCVSWPVVVRSQVCVRVVMGSQVACACCSK